MESAMLRILAEHGQREFEKIGKANRGGGENPILQAIAMHTMQQPPPNLPMLSSLYTQKLEKDLRRDLESPDPMDDLAADPLHQENRSLQRMVTNMRLKMDMFQMQREMARTQGEAMAMQGMAQQNPAVAAAAGGLPPEAGGIPPEVAAQQAAPGQQQAPQGAPMAGAPGVAPQASPGSSPMGVGPVEAASM